MLKVKFPELGWWQSGSSSLGPEIGQRRATKEEEEAVSFKTNIPHFILSAETLGHREVKEYLEPPYRFPGLVEAGRRRWERLLPGPGCECQQGLLYSLLKGGRS